MKFQANFIYLYIYSANWVEINGVLYQRPSVLVIAKDNEKGEPVFGEILDIFYHDQFIFFYVEVLSYMYFSNHFDAHIVSTVATEKKYLVYYDNLYDYQPFGLYLPSFMSHSDLCRFVVFKQYFM